MVRRSRKEESRRCVPKILTMFDRDPRPPPVHSAYTWRLLRPGSVFRKELELFGQGGSPLIVRVEL